MDLEGRLRLSYGTATDIGFGSVTSFEETFSKSCTVTPLVSLTVYDTFVIETGSQKTYTFGFSRVHPAGWTEGDDASSDINRWSNRKWYEAVTTAMNRWQARTNGFVMSYAPDSTNPYIPARISSISGGLEENGYIKNLSLTYAQADNTVIKGTMEFHVGTMFPRVVHPDPTTRISRNDFQVQISDSTESVYVSLLGYDSNGDVLADCIESYTLYGGIETPFEYAEITVPKRRLSSVAVQIFENIVAGRNRVMLNAVGKCINMFVKSCELKNSRRDYVITAYCVGAKVSAASLEANGTMTPFQWVATILQSGKYAPIVYPDHTDFIYAFRTRLTDTLSFSEGTNVWYILQLCAMLLGCKIFFAEDRCYMVDYTIPLDSCGVDCRSDYDVVYDSEGTASYVYNSSYPSPNEYGMVQESGGVKDANIQLYRYGKNSGTASNGKYVFQGRVVGDVKLGGEGTDTIVNSISVSCTSIDSEGVKSSGSKQCVDSESITRFGVFGGNTVHAPELLQSDDTVTGDDVVRHTQASTFGNNLIKYRSEPQQSISFSLKEIESTGSEVRWVPMFPVSFGCHTITDAVNDVSVSNDSTIDEARSPVRHKLLLSSYERTYPEGISKYTFGLMANIDLSSSTSQTMSSLNNR